MSFEARREEYRQNTELFLSFVTTLSDEIIDYQFENEWTPRQILHHMADSEMQSAIRLRRLIAEEPGTVIQGYDEVVWAENEILGYRTSDWRPAIALIVAVRASSFEVLARLTEQDLTRSGIHTESGVYSLDTWLDIYVRHPLEHAAQIKKIFEKLIDPRSEQ